MFVVKTDTVWYQSVSCLEVPDVPSPEQCQVICKVKILFHSCLVSFGPVFFLQDNSCCTAWTWTTEENSHPVCRLGLSSINCVEMSRCCQNLHPLFINIRNCANCSVIPATLKALLTATSAVLKVRNRNLLLETEVI